MGRLHYLCLNIPSGIPRCKDSFWYVTLFLCLLVMYMRTPNPFECIICLKIELHFLYLDLIWVSAPGVRQHWCLSAPTFPPSPAPFPLSPFHHLFSGKVPNGAYHSGDQVKKNEMGRTCGTYGGEERFIQGFSGETWGKKTTWKTQA